MRSARSAGVSVAAVGGRTRVAQERALECVDHLAAEASALKLTNFGSRQRLVSSQAELLVSAGRCTELRRLAQEAMHTAASAVVRTQNAGLHPKAADCQSSWQWQTDLSADDVSADELAPRLLTALKAQHTVWQRVKVALLSHFAGRLRMQLAAERASAAAAAAGAQQREDALGRHLQDVQKVPLKMPCRMPDVCG